MTRAVPSRTARLLLVDLQRDYLASPNLQPAAGAVVRRARALLNGCREIGVPVAHVWTTVSRDDDRRMPHWKREGRWLCEEGTLGHQPPPGLETSRGETVVHKRSFGAFATGELDRLLVAEGTDLLVIAGVHLHACVRQAVLDAYEHDGVEIWVAEDATGSNDPVHAAITRRYLARRAARFLTVDEVLHGLRRPAAGWTKSGTDDQVRATARRCRAALAAWQVTDAGSRLRLLECLADQIESEADGLSRSIAVEIGKPVRYGSIEARRTAQMLRAVVAHAAQTEEVETVGSAELRRRPLGTVAIVTPWNNPVYIPLGKIAPALAYGNAVLWKPAPEALTISERVVSLLDRVGFPPDVVGLVPGGRRAAVAAMSDPGVDAVALTGSSRAGFAAQEVCSSRRIPLQAELGGNNAALVWLDADLYQAAGEVAEGAFAVAGQRCTANRRVVVHDECRSELLEHLARETRALRWGDPLDPETCVGPLVSHQAQARVADLVATTQSGPNHSIVPHGRMTPPGCSDGAWYPPTIVSCDDSSHELVQEETFGPLLVVQTAADWDHAMALVNGVNQGLVSALFTSSPDIASRFLEEAAAGILKINRSTADATVDVPFGGWKWSGIGPPEHGCFDRDFYTLPQVVYGRSRGLALGRGP